MQGDVVPLYETGEPERLDEASHAELLKTALDWFAAADRRRQPHVDEWRKQYAMYRSFVQPRRKGEWESRVYMPISFHVIETEMPKLVADLPIPLALPVGPEDVEPAAKMEDRLRWSFDQSGLYVQLVAGYRSAIKYGTGILKVYPGRRQGWAMQDIPQTEQVEISEPSIDPATGEQMLDMDGQPLMDTRTEEQPTGASRSVRQSFPYYEGPICEAIDIEDFWPSPEATSVEDAIYVLHRVWRDEAYVRAKIQDGTYSLPAGHSIEDLWEQEDSAAAARMGEIGLSSEVDSNRKVVEVWEFWTNDNFMTVLNRRLVVRLQPIPFAHGQKPFVRVLDHFQEHEFWGIGELGPIAGLQDAINALWNSRIDNVRLVLNRIFAVNPDHLYDVSDLRLRPGGVIRIRSSLGINPAELIFPIDMPDVTSSAYTESAELERLIEKVTGVSSYTAGLDSPSQNDTATGVALISEQGNSRFSLKIRMAELTALVPLARMFGSILQQFSPQEQWIRREGQNGFEFSPVTAAEIQGSIDYDIEAESSTQTETIRRQQALDLYDLFANGAPDPMTGMPTIQVAQLVRDLLKVYGKKDLDRYMVDQEALMQQMAVNQNAAMAGAPGGYGMAPPPTVEQDASQMGYAA